MNWCRSFLSLSDRLLARSGLMERLSMVDRVCCIGEADEQQWSTRGALHHPVTTRVCKRVDPVVGVAHGPIPAWRRCGTSKLPFTLNDISIHQPVPSTRRFAQLHRSAHRHSLVQLLRPTSCREISITARPSRLRRKFSLLLTPNLAHTANTSPAALLDTAPPLARTAPPTILTPWIPERRRTPPPTMLLSHRTLRHPTLRA